MDLRSQYQAKNDYSLHLHDYFSEWNKCFRALMTNDLTFDGTPQQNKVVQIYRKYHFNVYFFLETQLLNPEIDDTITLKRERPRNSIRKKRRTNISPSNSMIDEIIDTLHTNQELINFNITKLNTYGNNRRYYAFRVARWYEILSTQGNKIFAIPLIYEGDVNLLVKKQPPPKVDTLYQIFMSGNDPDLGYFLRFDSEYSHEVNIFDKNHWTTDNLGDDQYNFIHGIYANIPDLDYMINEFIGYRLFKIKIRGKAAQDLLLKKKEKLLEFIESEKHRQHFNYLDRDNFKKSFNLSSYRIPNRVKFLLDRWPAETGENDVRISKANNLIFQLYDIYEIEKILFRRYLEKLYPNTNIRTLPRNEKKLLFKEFMRAAKKNQQARSTFQTPTSGPSASSASNDEEETFMSYMKQREERGNTSKPFAELYKEYWNYLQKKGNI